jgi:hypothetical protein
VDVDVEVEVIDLVDSDDEVVEARAGAKSVTVKAGHAEVVDVESAAESDEAMARRLAAEWDAEDSGGVGAVKGAVEGEIQAEVEVEVKAEDGRAGGSRGNGIERPKRKGKGKATMEDEQPIDISQDVIDVADKNEDEDDEPVKPKIKSEPKPVHPLFQVSQSVDRPSIPTSSSPHPAGPSKPKTTVFGTKTAPKEAVPPIDFDSDALLFRPASVDTTLWPDGRLPYSVLVGVYVQVAATRSRLTIVRVLTK